LENTHPLFDASVSSVLSSEAGGSHQRTESFRHRKSRSIQFLISVDKIPM